MEIYDYLIFNIHQYFQYIHLLVHGYTGSEPQHNDMFGWKILITHSYLEPWIYCKKLAVGGDLNLVLFAI